MPMATRVKGPKFKLLKMKDYNLTNSKTGIRE